MEFDTSVKLVPTGSLKVSPGKDYEAWLEDVSTILRSVAAHVGDSRAGEFWVDYSTALQTRHIVLNVEDTGEGVYEVKFRAGKRPGRLADVLVMGLVLLGMWCLSKSFVPSPLLWHVAGAVLSLAGAAGVAAYCYGKTFGRKETAQLMEKFKK